MKALCPLFGWVQQNEIPLIDEIILIDKIARLPSSLNDDDSTSGHDHIFQTNDNNKNQQRKSFLFSQYDLNHRTKR